MKLTPNIVINNRYILMKQIAVGGMGEMWIAKDSILGRSVAVKAMREEHAGNEDFLQRLRIEARNNAVLTHPNIVALHDYYEQNRIGFIVMEYVEGQTLANMLYKTPIMPLEQLLPILSQIARALKFAHTRGIIHRDIKPANVLVEPDGFVKVVDFGVSRAQNQMNMTAAGMIVGTVQYLSPEQAIGDEATPQSDIYALGVIAYEASQGRRPFDGKNAVDIAIAQVNASVPLMTENKNAAFEKLVMNLLEKNVKNRAVDAGKVADQFDEILKSLKQSQQPPKNSRVLRQFRGNTSTFITAGAQKQPAHSSSHKARAHPQHLRSQKNEKSAGVDTARSQRAHSQRRSDPSSHKNASARLISPVPPNTRYQLNTGRRGHKNKSQFLDANMWFLIIIICIIIGLLMFIGISIGNDI
ncbi:MAG: serine/threonine protein kinase [Candidatus Ancillula trichonymphae]|nr:serine/threonine protein kinase [Candidatus Ancillula trichonymphae]